MLFQPLKQRDDQVFLKASGKKNCYSNYCIYIADKIFIEYDWIVSKFACTFLKKKISTEYQFGTLFHHINFGSKQRSFDVLFRSTLHWWTLKYMESSSNCLITYPGKITNHSIFLFRNLDQRSKRDHKRALYSVQEWKHKIWPVNCKHWAQKCCPYLFYHWFLHHFWVIKTHQLIEWFEKMRIWAFAAKRCCFWDIW